MLAENVGKAVKGCEWCGIAFAGSMCEAVHIDARTLVINDKHRWLMNLATIVADPLYGPKLIRKLRRVPFHTDALKRAQATFKELEPMDVVLKDDAFDRALAYFICAWMARNGTAGTDKEFDAPLSIRWEAGGGDSCVRFRSATESLRDWRKILQRATFTALDVFDFLAKCKDRKGHAIYADAPFPGPGDSYKHRFSAAQQERLAGELAGFKETRIVCRFYDIPMIRDLYPETHWQWNLFTGRKQTNAPGPEVLLVRN
jgi:hypothetical protein